MIARVAFALVLLGLGWLGPDGRTLAAQARTTGFDHPKHAKLFPRCESCHQGAAEPAQAIFPEPSTCTECHDGAIEARVDWRPRAGPAPTNLRFEHGRHATAAARSEPTPDCASCHQPSGAGRMTTTRTIVAQCLSCHRLGPEHLAVPDSACATCHLTLAAATSLPAERVKAFKAPFSHRTPGFLGTGPAGHGAAAAGNGRVPVAASCATCHARDFCIVCHVNAPETPTIQALALDARSLLHKAELAAPASHRARDFERRHGADLGKRGEKCATCHTQESCASCHAVTPRAASRLAATTGPGRGVGAKLVRTRPITHGVDFTDRHARPATSAAASCAACHTRSDCLDCHRPDPARASGFHPSGFLTRHPAAAYNRETSCADCHNVQQFCSSCHAQAGTTSRGALGTGSYHDGKRFFLLGHGQAARQNLESCVSCHAERDCVTCHASQGGRRFNPHGPGFDPERLRRKNPEMCRACHGLAIPTRGP